nr:MAG TPA: YqzM-like protein [Caudoviricetes sp.]
MFFYIFFGFFLSIVAIGTIVCFIGILFEFAKEAIKSGRS